MPRPTRATVFSETFCCNSDARRRMDRRGSVGALHDTGKAGKSLAPQPAGERAQRRADAPGEARVDAGKLGPCLLERQVARQRFRPRGVLRGLRPCDLLLGLQPEAREISLRL